MAKVIMRFPGGRKKAVTLSYDDGVEQDVRLLAIMKENGLKGTFNLNSGLFAPEGTIYPPEKIVSRVMTKAQTIALFKDSGMEVAVHGLTHPFLEELSPEMCTFEILKDRENLEEAFQTVVRGMAYPFATYDEKVIACAKSAGIVYSRGNQSTGKFDLPKNWLEMNGTCHHNDPRLMELAHVFINKTIINKSWLFYLWGHSYEFDKHDNWDVIEEFAQFVGNREDIWYATNIEIFDYVNAYQQLTFSVNGSRVFNPTAYKIWFELNNISYCIEPGEKFEIKQAR